MENAPVLCVPAQCFQNPVPDILDNGKIDIKSVGYGSAKAPPIWDLEMTLAVISNYWI